MPLEIHGMSGSPEYAAWEAMRNRCANPNYPLYSRYGGRGISVCPQWASFKAFYRDMGARPGDSYSLDRIDVDGNYEPGNCRWATQLEQQRNRSNNRLLNHEGVTATVAELAERAGINRKTVGSRLKAGATIEVALMKGRLPRGTIGKELEAKT